MIDRSQELYRTTDVASAYTTVQVYILTEGLNELNLYLAMAPVYQANINEKRLESVRRLFQ